MSEQDNKDEKKVENSTLLKDLLEDKILTTSEINDQLPAPRCVHCNLRMDTIFEDMIRSKQNPEVFFEKDDLAVLNYCDKMSLFNDYYVYQKCIALKKNEKR